MPSMMSFSDPLVQMTMISYIQLTERAVYNSVMNLDSTKATGPDNIPAIFLKNCAYSLSESLTSLFNLSLRTRTVPSQWKMANVVLIYKKGPSSKVNNYWPVSLLSIFSKCLEKCVHNKIYCIVDQMLHLNQHGFRKGHSTTSWSNSMIRCTNNSKNVMWFI